MSADSLAAPFRAIRVVDLVDLGHEDCLFLAEVSPGDQLGKEVCTVFSSQHFHNVHDFLIPESLNPRFELYPKYIKCLDYASASQTQIAYYKLGRD